MPDWIIKRFEDAYSKYAEDRLVEVDEIEQTLDEFRSTGEDLQRQLTDLQITSE